MMKYIEKNEQHLTMPLLVKEEGKHKQGEEKRIPAKRVDIVSLKLVKESSMLYKNRSVSSPEDAYHLLKQFLGEVDREHFIVICLDTKNQPTAIILGVSPPLL